MPSSSTESSNSRRRAARAELLPSLHCSAQNIDLNNGGRLGTVVQPGTEVTAFTYDQTPAAAA